MKLTKILVAACLLPVGGCAAHGWSDPHAPGEASHLEPAPLPGVYRLYAGENAMASHKVHLLEGDQIGFSRDAKGQLLAVGGIRRWSLPEGKYHWFLPESDADFEGPSPTARRVGAAAAEVVKISAALALFAGLEYLQAWSDRLDEGDAGSPWNGSRHHDHEHAHGQHPINEPQTKPSHS